MSRYRCRGDRLNGAAERIRSLATGVAASLLLALALLGGGCGLLVSPKRAVERRVDDFRVAVHRRENRKAESFFASGAYYYEYGSKTPTRPATFIH